MKGILQKMLALLIALSMILGTFSICFAETPEETLQANTEQPAVEEIVNQAQAEMKEISEPAVEEETGKEGTETEAQEVIEQTEQTEDANTDPVGSEGEEPSGEEEKVEEQNKTAESEEERWINQKSGEEQETVGNPDETEEKSQKKEPEENEAPKKAFTLTSKGLSASTSPMSSSSLSLEFADGFTPNGNMGESGKGTITVESAVDNSYIYKGKTYYQNTTVTLTVVPTDGYAVDEVYYRYSYKHILKKDYKKIEIDGNDNTYSFTVAKDTVDDYNEPVVIGATFKKECTITLYVNGQGSVSYNGTKVAQNSSDSFIAYTGDTIYLNSFKCDDGYEFDSDLIISGAETSKGQKYFTVAESDITVTAAVKPIQYTITNNSNSLSVTGTAIVGEPVKITDKGVSGKKLSALKVYKKGSYYPFVTLDPQAGNLYEFTMPASNVTITAEYKDLHDITIGFTGSGTITASPIEAIEGETVTLTISPEEKYVLDKNAFSVEYKDAIGWSHSITCSFRNDNTQVTFTMPDKDVTVNASFRRNSTIFLVAEGNGSLKYKDSTESFVRLSGNKVSLDDIKCEAATGYEFVGLAITNTSGEAIEVKTQKGGIITWIIETLTDKGNYFVVPEDDVTITAKFEAVQYDVSKYVVGLGSESITVAGTPTIDSTITITDNNNENESGYRLAAINVYRIKQGLIFDYTNFYCAAEKNNDGTYTFTMPANDVTIVATYKKLHTIQCEVSGQGSIETTSLPAIEGENVSFAVKPGIGLILDESTFKVNGISKSKLIRAQNEGVTIYTFEMPDNDITVHADFIIEPILVNNEGVEQAAPEDLYTITSGVDCRGKVLTIKAGETDLIVNGNTYAHVIVDKDYTGELTLRNVTLENYAECSQPVIESEDDLNLVIEGNVTVTGNNVAPMAALRACYTYGLVVDHYIYKDIVITGSADSKLTIDSASGYGVHCADLTVTDIQLEANAKYHAIWTEDDLTIGSAKVDASTEGYTSADLCNAAVKVEKDFAISGDNSAYLYAVNYNSSILSLNPRSEDIMPAVHFENVVSESAIYALGNSSKIDKQTITDRSQFRLLNYSRELTWHGHKLPDICQGKTYYDGWFCASTVYLRPAFVNVEGTVTMDSVIKENIPTGASIQISLMQGKNVVCDYVGVPYSLTLNSEDSVTSEGAIFGFVGVPNGNYNIVVTVPTDNPEKPMVVTVGITVPSTAETGVVHKDISVKDTKASSELEVTEPEEDELKNNNVKTEQTVVTGLDEVAESFVDELAQGRSVEVKLTVEEKQDLTASNGAVEADIEIKKQQQAIKDRVAEDGKVDFIDMKVEKSVEGEAPEALSSLPAVIEVAIPYDMSGEDFNPEYINVARNHNGKVEFFTKLEGRPTQEQYKDGTCYVWFNAANPSESVVYIYTSEFSTYAIIYGEVLPEPELYYDTYHVSVKGSGLGIVKVDKEWAIWGETVVVTPQPRLGYKAVVNVYKKTTNAEVKITAKENGTYVFSMPADNVVVNVAFVCLLGEECPMLRFGDLNPKMWYHDGIHFGLELEYFEGVTETAFEPYSSVTKAQLVTLLYRLAGSPEVEIKDSFSDIKGYWFETAAMWAKNTDLVGANELNRFEGKKAVTREQMAEIMFRFAKNMGYDVSVGEETNILSYDDALSIRAYAIPAMQWMCGAGLYKGQENKLMPGRDINRAEYAAVLMRFCEKYGIEENK